MARLTRALAHATMAVLLLAVSVTRAADPTEDVGDGTRVNGKLQVTCTPDEKSKAAGDTPFDDTITLADDRVDSAALAQRGFPPTLSIPKTVNGIVTMTAVFKKQGGEKATYSIRIRKDQTVNGSLTIVKGKERHRYVVRTKGTPVGPDPDASDTAKAGKHGKSKAAVARGADADPGVIRIDGGFVRLMTTNVAMTESGVTDKAKKAKVAEIQKAAGTDWQAIKGTYLSGAITAAEYVEVAGRRLDDANGELKALLGEDIADLDAAFAKPVTSEFLYHQALRTALAELDDPDKTALANKALVQSMRDLGSLTHKPAGRAPDVFAKFRELTEARMKKALPAADWASVQKTVDASTSYRPDQTAPPAPVELP